MYVYLYIEMLTWYCAYLSIGGADDGMFEIFISLWIFEKKNKNFSQIIYNH